MIYKDPQGFQYRRRERPSLLIQPGNVGNTPMIKTANGTAALLQSFCMNYVNTTGGALDVTAYTRLSDSETEEIKFFRQDDFALSDGERLTYGLDKVPSLDSTLIPTETIFEAGLYTGKATPEAYTIFASWANITQPAQ